MTCGAGEELVPEINLGRAALYDVSSGSKVSAKFYMRQLSDSGTVIPYAKSYIFKIRADNENDVPVGWVKLS